MAVGLSFEAFAGVCEVSRQTLYDWQGRNKDFAEAYAIGREKCRLFWEKIGIDGLYTITEYDEKGRPIVRKVLNPVIWIFNMKNRFRDEWGEKAEDKSPLPDPADVKVLAEYAKRRLAK